MAAFYLHGLTDARPYVDVWCWLPFFFCLGYLPPPCCSNPERFGARRNHAAHGVAGAGVFACILLVLFLSASTIKSNLACLNQARADLDAHLETAQRDQIKQDAKEGFIHAIALKPNNRTPHLRLGLIYTEDRRFSAAVTELEAAHQADPTNFDRNQGFGIGVCLERQDRQSGRHAQDLPELSKS